MRLLRYLKCLGAVRVEWIGHLGPQFLFRGSAPPNIRRCWLASWRSVVNSRVPRTILSSMPTMSRSRKTACISR